MPSGPKVKLSIDLQKMSRYFPFDPGPSSGFELGLMIEREFYDSIEELMNAYRVFDDVVIREFCFIILWIRREIQADDNLENTSGKLFLMWEEIDAIREYLLKHRITSISLHGETERNKPGRNLVIREEINIDRLCDGIRTVFREDFLQDKKRRRTKGQRAWQRRRMVRVSNNILNYFTSVPETDELSLEEQNELIDKLAELAGLPEWRREL